MGGGYNMIKGPGFLGTGGRDRSKNAAGESADPGYADRMRAADPTWVDPYTQTAEQNQKAALDRLKKQDDAASGKTKLDEELAKLQKPTLSDELYATARKKAAFGLLTGSRRASFLTGSEGVVSPSVFKRQLIGG